VRNRVNVAAQVQIGSQRSTATPFYAAAGESGIIATQRRFRGNVAAQVQIGSQRSTGPPFYAAAGED